MTIIYRTTGAWGSGKGSNLTAAEVDGNFWDLVQRIEDVESNPLAPVNIADIVLTGNQLTVFMTDGSTFGPFFVPVAAFSWTDEWQAGFSYEPFDVFIAQGDGVYLVINPYEAPTEFDPDDSNIRKMFDVADQAIVPVVNAETPTDTTFALGLEHMGSYLRFESETRVVPPQLALDGQLPVGSVVVIRRATDDDVYIEPVSPIVVNTPETYYLRANGSTATLIKVAAGVWDLSGDLEQVD